MNNWFESNYIIKKEFKFETYMDGINFTVDVAKVAESINHHPDITIGYKKVVIASTTHDQGGIVTQKDHALKNKIENLYKEKYSI